MEFQTTQQATYSMKIKISKWRLYMRFIETRNAPPAIGPYTQAIVANGMVYTSGQVPLDEHGRFG